MQSFQALLVRIVSNPTVRKSLLALVLAVLAAAGVSLGSGCGASALPPAEIKARLECQIKALETVVPRRTALELIEAAQASEWDRVAERLVGLGVTSTRIHAAADAFRACSASRGTPDAGTP